MSHSHNCNEGSKVVLAAATAHGTETITVVKMDVPADSYWVASFPSAESKCAPVTRLFPATASAVKAFQKALGPYPTIFGDVTWTCKAQLYEGIVGGTCGVYKLSGCVCTSGCNQLPLP